MHGGGERPERPGRLGSQPEDILVEPVRAGEPAAEGGHGPHRPAAIWIPPGVICPGGTNGYSTVTWAGSRGWPSGRAWTAAARPPARRREPGPGSRFRACPEDLQLARAQDPSSHSASALSCRKSCVSRGCADCSGGLAAERMIIMSRSWELTGAIAGHAAAVARARPLPRLCTAAAASVAAIPVPAPTSLGQDW